MLVFRGVFFGLAIVSPCVFMSEFGEKKDDGSDGNLFGFEGRYIALQLKLYHFFA